MGHVHDWAAYLAGALLALTAKWWYWCRTGQKAGTPVWTSTKQWFDVTRTEDQVSWLATVAIVWCGGYVYLARVRVGWEWVEARPVAVPFAFLLGIVMEYTAPAAFKWGVGRLPFGGSGNTQ